ncbi:hypothetical protein PGIGA_G00073610 [Pangasianodon gigas]|uniref:Uncharacterized protein n=1 Tax=Pangasianodon gigas TaxID=30993 RepID=A0ACC5X7R0_PANGG|nr:hypothetical protein [Pangasianodon gigas]
MAVTSTLYRVSGRRDCRSTRLSLPGNNTYKESPPPKPTLPMMHHKPLSKMSVGHVVLQHMSIRRNPADQHTDCSLFRDGHTRGTSPIH